MVVKQVLEPQLELTFDQDSYGYRPGKSAHQAVEACGVPVGRGGYGSGSMRKR